MTHARNIDEENTKPKPAVVIISADMMMQMRLQDAVEKAGGQPFVVDESNTDEEAVATVDASLPFLILVDLAYSGNTSHIIRRCKIRPHTRHIPLYAFGSHVEAEVLQRAREAGADHAWARSRFVRELPQILTAGLHPPVEYPEGWDDELSELAQKGVEEFNRGDYFEQHEYFEEAWMAEPRPIRSMYQGLLQVGVAFYHIENDNWSGAMKLFRRGLPKLRHLPSTCQGIALSQFRAEAEAIHTLVTTLGAEKMDQFDRTRFPKIRLADTESADPEAAINRE